MAKFINSQLDEERVAGYREKYHESGFITLPRIIGDAELDWLGAIYTRLFVKTGVLAGAAHQNIAARPASEVAGLPEIVRPEKYAPELLKTSHFATCLRIASILLDCPPDQLDHYAHLILKPAGCDAETPWHQDEAYMDPQWQRRGLSIWMTLEETTADSGCMYFVPGSHRSEVVDHHHIRHDARIRGLMTDHVDATAAVPCPLGPGEVSVHDLRTLHYAGPNTSPRDCRSYVVVVTTPATFVDAPPRPWLTG